MSKRSRQRNRSARSSAPTPAGARAGGARTKSADLRTSGDWRHATEVVFGLVLLCFSVLMLDLTCRTFLFWQQRDDYVLTELKVTEGISNDEGTSFRGVIAATGEEIYLTHTPSEFIEYDSPRDPVGTLMPAEKARGMKLPIWFAQHHTSFFSSSGVHFLSEYPSLPSGSQVLGLLASTLAVVAIGVWSTIVGIRRSRPIVPEPD